LAKGSTAIVAFNRGLVSPLALSRVDLKRSAFSAAEQVNWMPRVLGSMSLRPGLQYIGAAPSRPKTLPFVFSTDDTAIIELTESAMRVWAEDTLISRPSVSTAITNGSFLTDVSSWTDSDEVGATSDWTLPGYLRLLGTGSAAAIRDQVVSVAIADRGVEHALQIIVARGPVTLRVGTFLGNDDLIHETELATGAHSLAFTPTSDFYIRLFSSLSRYVLVNSINIESAGAMVVAAPWAGEDLRKVRADQSGDVLFVACNGYQQRRIERRAARSWSVVLYAPEDGPFRTENVGPITITPSALSGNITLAASKSLFRSRHVGGLFRLTSQGQRVTADISAADTFTNSIEVTGVGETRRFSITRDGTWVATVTLQRSIGVEGLWEDVESYTTDDAITYADGLDNQIVYYRIGIKTAGYTSGTATLTLSYSLGSIVGIVRITDYTTSTSVSAEVLSDLGGTDATDIWSEGQWSDYRGWPTAVAFAEGRLWWVGKNAIIASISDAFDSFDPDFEGAAGPIIRTVGSGPVDDIQWLVAARRLLMGAEGAELTIKSSALDEPLTPTNFNVKEVASQGSAQVQALKVDTRAVFVQRSAYRVYELAYSAEVADYDVSDLTALVPEIGAPGIVTIAVQRQPDTRIHCVRSDGTVAIAVIDPAEKVLSWQEFETDGEVQDVCVLPGNEEDQVYYVVKRTIGSSGLYFIDVDTNGTGYTSPPDVVLTGGGGVNASAECTLAAVSATVQAAGSGYSVGDLLTVLGGLSTSAAQASVATVDGGGGVLSITLFSLSGRYTEVPANPVSTSGGGGSGCKLTVTWGVGRVTVLTVGGGYTTVPTVSFSGGGGTGAAATGAITSGSLAGYYLEKWAKESECRGDTLNKQADSFIEFAGTSATVSGGFISSLTVTPGIGYEVVPTLSIVAGGGSGAAASITLQLVNTESGADVLAPGSGYSVGDVLTAVGGTYRRPARVQVRHLIGGSGGIFGFQYSIIDGGSYSVLPAPSGSALSFTGGTGSGFKLRAVYGLGDATLSNPGSGYTSTPLVSVSATPTASIPGVAADIAGSVSAAISVTTVTASATAAAVISGLSHLEGAEVVVWGDGLDLSPDDDDGIQTTYTVRGGQISLGQSVSQAIVGLPYRGTWKSAKLATITDQGYAPSLNQRKRISQLGLVLADTHARGLYFGADFDTMDCLPRTEQDAVVDADTVHTAYDEDMIEFPGDYSTDSRLCLLAKAPRPVTVLSAVMAIEESTKS
jgi:hypothetical protein